MNQTREDACARLVSVTVGSVVDASEEYLVALRQRLFEWIERVDEELSNVWHRELIAAAAEAVERIDPDELEGVRGEPIPRNE